eukprot:GEMP01067141.1.p1 GENE.GEMP01067141.1~~GEMP01067141.1.p1  ORF type:complete len:141 (+),score=14.66 GEMP01067141.1:144-566(+)
MGASLPVDGQCCHRRYGNSMDIPRDPNELVSTKWPTYVHVGRISGTWSLRVMSYDVLCDTKCTKRHFAFAHEESLCPVRRLHLVARRIRHLSPDVLCLQEVMNPRALLDVIFQCAVLLLLLFTTPPNPIKGIFVVLKRRR